MVHSNLNTQDIKQHFQDELKAQRFTEDRNGGKMIELLGASFIADAPAIIGTPKQEYIAAEISWYESQSTNIYDLSVGSKIPVAWEMTANKHGEINSNYGHLIFSEKYFTQYWHAMNELRNNPDSRRATMVYTRPSIWHEFNENGKNDFICTNAVTYYIRENKLHCVVQMRSNDVVFGYKNDFAWQEHLMYRMFDDLALGAKMEDLEMGNIYWQVQNLHVYERHFWLLEEVENE